MRILTNTELYYLAKDLAKQYPNSLDIKWMSDKKVSDLEFYDISKLKQRITIQRLNNDSNN